MRKVNGQKWLLSCLLVLGFVLAGCPSEKAPDANTDKAAGAADGARGAGEAAKAEAKPDSNVVKFTRKGPAKGDSWTRTSDRGMRMKITAKMGDKSREMDKGENKHEKSKFEVLEVKGDSVVKAKVTYMEHSKTQMDSGKESKDPKSPIEGKTYLLSLDDAGVLVVTDAEGKAPSAPELAAVKSNNKSFGKPNKFAELVPEEVEKGKAINITKEMMADILGNNDESAKGTDLKEATLVLKEVKEVNGQKAGVFELSAVVILSEMNMKMALKGDLIVGVDNTWPIKLDLNAPVTIEPKPAAEGDEKPAMSLSGGGTMSLKIDNDYGK